MCMRLWYAAKVWLLWLIQPLWMQSCPPYPSGGDGNEQAHQTHGETSSSSSHNGSSIAAALHNFAFHLFFSLSLSPSLSVCLCFCLLFCCVPFIFTIPFISLSPSPSAPHSLIILVLRSLLCLSPLLSLPLSLSLSLPLSPSISPFLSFCALFLFYICPSISMPVSVSPPWVMTRHIYITKAFLSVCLSALFSYLRLILFFLLSLFFSLLRASLVPAHLVSSLLRPPSFLPLPLALFLSFTCPTHSLSLIFLPSFSPISLFLDS